MSKNRTDKFRPTTDDSALQDTEAHKLYSGSDRGIKHDVDDVTWDDGETEGHRIYNTSDRTTKHGVEDVAWEDEDEDEDGTEGHGVRVRI